MLCQELSRGQTQRRCKNNPAVTSLAMSRCSKLKLKLKSIELLTKFETIDTYSLFPAQESCDSFGRRCLGKSFHLDL